MMTEELTKDTKQTNATEELTQHVTQPDIAEIPESVLTPDAHKNAETDEQVSSAHAHSFFEKPLTAEEWKTGTEEIASDLNEHKKVFTPVDDITQLITEDHIREYLEGAREAKSQEFKERREQRLLTAFQLAASLGATTAVVYFLKDNPAILVNILYIIGGIAAFWIWKRR